MPTKINSFQEPCSKCQKKSGTNQKNWIPCKNCPWTTQNQELEQKKLTECNNGKICLECQEFLNFIELEKGKYLCGKNKCLRSYIERKTEKCKKEQLEDF